MQEPCPGGSLQPLGLVERTGLLFWNHLLQNILRFCPEGLLHNVRIICGYALAECEEERLLKLWEGLGYYNRVRNMHHLLQNILRFCPEGLLHNVRIICGYSCDNPKNIPVHRWNRNSIGNGGNGSCGIMAISLYLENSL